MPIPISPTNFLSPTSPTYPRPPSWAGLLRSRFRSAIPIAFVIAFGLSIYYFFSSLAPSPFDLTPPGPDVRHPHFRPDGFGRVGHPEFPNPAAWVPPPTPPPIELDSQTYAPQELMNLPVLHRTASDPFDPVNGFKPLRDAKSPWLPTTPSGALLISRLSRSRFPPPESPDALRGSVPPPIPIWPKPSLLREKPQMITNPLPRESLYHLDTSSTWPGRNAVEQGELPKVQWAGFDQPGWESEEDRVTRLERQGWVRRAFQHVWEGYKANAWGHDELKPISGSFADPFSGWGATLVDCLDTLLIMNMTREYNYARTHVKAIDWAHTLDIKQLREGVSDPYQPTIPFFETVIRYVGGLISAYDLSGDELMLERVEELAQWLLPAFATASGLPMVRYQLGTNPNGQRNGRVCLAEIGSLTLEFTRLAQLTSKDYYHNIVQKITDVLDGDQWKSSLRPGTLLPIYINPEQPESMAGEYTFGGMADSYYEYLIKEHQLLRGTHSQYSRMFGSAIDSARQHLIKTYELESSGGKSLTVIGDLAWGQYKPSIDHLTCFSGGMIGLGSRLLGRTDDLDLALNNTDACVWAYEITKTGVGAERMKLMEGEEYTKWQPVRYKGTVYRQLKLDAPPGVTIVDSRYLGRPETIESVFYMWRITGDKQWQDRGWRMFTNWMEACITQFGFADLIHVDRLPAQKEDKEESFVLAETLKYYYLLFSDPDMISLDDYVLNTEAHPFEVKKKSEPKSRLWDGPDPVLDILYDPRGQSGSDKNGFGTVLQQWSRVDRKLMDEEDEKVFDDVLFGRH